MTSFSYDLVGNLLTETDPLSRVTTYEYDNLDRNKKVTAPDPDAGGPLTSPVTQFTFDSVNNLLTETDPLSHVTSYQYDNLYRLTQRTEPDPDGGGSQATPITSFTYDAAGNLLTLKDPVNNTTTWAYDNLNRVTSETNQLSHARSYVYDANSNLTKLTDRNGRVTEYVYDNLDRNTQELWKNGGSTIRTLSFTHDANSQLTAASDPAASYSYVYDNLGRVTQQTQTLTGLTPSIVFAQGWDANSNRTSLSATIGGTADFKNTYTYDNLSRTTRITQEDQTGGNVVADKRVDLSYKTDGQFDVISRFADMPGTQAVASSAYGYDGMGRLNSLAHTTNAGGTTLASYGLAYDAASRIASINSLIDGVTNYTHDNTDQLTGADHTGSTDETYTYDANGNRTMSGYSVATNNRLSSDGTYNYTYDDEGNRLTRTNIATGAVTEYEWDYRNRLTKATEKNSGGTVVETTEHSYDVFDRWIRRSHDADGAGSGSAVDTFFANDGNQIALQFDGNGASNLSHRYLWGPAVDQLLADEQVTSLSSAGNTLWGLSDHLGTIRDIADRNESTGVTSVTNYRVYNSFGAVTSESNSAVDLLFGYTGRAFDETTGLQNNWHRWYDPATGQWISEDPIGFLGRDSNLRRYVDNSPTSATDPSGLVKPLAVFRGLGKVFFDKNTLEFVLENGKRVKIRNSKFISSTVSLTDLETLTGVCDARITRLRQKYGDGLAITFDDIGQPDFSRFSKHTARLTDPFASNYSDLAWEDLRKRNPKKYAELYRNKDQYDWHHAADRSLQLIDKDLHAAYQHTGVHSIYRNLKALGGAAIISLIPGAAQAADGNFNRAGLEIAVECSPFSISKMGADMLDWFYSWVELDLYGSEYQQEMDAYREDFWNRVDRGDLWEKR